MKKTVFYKAMYAPHGVRYDRAEGWEETYTAYNGDRVTVVYSKTQSGAFWQATEKSTGFLICTDRDTRAAAVEFVTGEKPYQRLTVHPAPVRIVGKPAGILDKLADKLQFCQNEKARLAAYIESLTEDLKNEN